LPKHLLPFPSHFNVELPKDTKLEQVCSKLESELSVLRYLVHTWVTKESCVGFAREDVWSRKARRKFSKEQHTKSANENDDPDMMDLEGQWKKAPKDVAALGFRIDLRLEADTSVSMVIRWLKGMDQVLFESFCGMIKRKFGEE
jgi:23S rRNA (adenine1618-N6)-methyltransferase